MSISIKKDSWHVKDGNGQYRGTAIFSSTLPSEAQQIVTESIAEINAVKATIPADYTELVDEVSDLSNAIDEIENISDITHETVGVTTGFGTGAASNTVRWFMSDIIPANSIITEVNYYCASSTSGTVDIEIWEKNGDTLVKAESVTQTPTAITWNKASFAYKTDIDTMVSFKPSDGNIRMDSLATGKVVYASDDLVSNTLSFAAFTPFDGFQLCANVSYVSKNDAENVYVVDKSGNGDFTSFSQALISVFAGRPNAIIIVNPGVYNVYQEMIDIYGSDYWDTITTSQADQKRNLFGLPFGNGMKIYGNDGAIVVMDNISTNVAVKTWFSVLHGEDDPESKFQGAEVRNIVINCRNIRYAVHLDFGSALNSGEYTIDSCKMQIDNSQNDAIQAAYTIGTGGGAYTTYNFRNNYLRSFFSDSARDHASIYYHNSAYANAKNRCNIEHNYIAGDGTIRTDPNGTSENDCVVMITGNSVGSEMLLYGKNGHNLSIVDWNNVLHTDPTITQLSNAIDANEESIADTQSMIATVEATTTASKNYAVGDLLVYDGKLYKVTSAIATGATIIVGSNVTQTTVEDQLGSGGGSGGAVDDVQINGNSIVSGGVADIPLASSSAAGVVKTSSGITVTGSGALQLTAPTDGQIKSGINDQLAVKINIQHKSAFYGLAKAAGDTTQSSSSNPVGTYTEDAKSAIHGMLNGAVAVSGTTPTIAAKDGITYVCGEVATLDITIPASGIFEVQFVSGSTPTVLTATGVSWAGGFDPTALEANKTYDISISNGIGVAVWI